MENSNIGGLGTAKPGVNSDSSPESKTPQAEDVLKNVKAEMNRKFSKINDQLQQLTQVLVPRNNPGLAVEADDANAPDYKKYVDARFQESQSKEVHSIHKKDYESALEQFPELDPKSDEHDEKFYQLVDKLYTKRLKDNDPEALKEAVEVAALRMGKVEKLTQDKFLKDEARRSRIIAEGTSSTREGGKEKETKLEVNESRLARLGIKAEKMKELQKRFPEKYKGN